VDDAKQKRKAIKELKKTQKKDVKKNKVTKKKKVTKAKSSSSENSDSDSENTPCLYCKGRYLKSTEGWVACAVCKKWAHCSCAGVEGEDDETAFTCDFCQQP
jgi:hypothetical protein